MKKFLMTLLLTALIAPPVLAHEGHGVPGAVKAKHGGTIQATHDFYLELVPQGDSLRLYPMTHDFEPIPLAEFQVEATAQLPRTKAKATVPFAPTPATEPREAHFTGSFDAKGAHRFTLAVVARFHGKKAEVVFQVEPR